MTADEIRQIMPYAGQRADIYAEPLTEAMEEFSINTRLRQAAFLAMIAHESGSLKYVKELASGHAYEGRDDLGNTEPGDGVRFKGRGLIQVTGRHWYERAAFDLDLDCVEHPELLETPENACRVSAWWWSVNKVNAIADTGDIRRVTKKVNGGYTGLAERTMFYERAKEVLA